jgi:hypothetical protein
MTDITQLQSLAEREPDVGLVLDDLIDAVGELAKLMAGFELYLVFCRAKVQRQIDAA